MCVREVERTCGNEGMLYIWCFYLGIHKVGEDVLCIEIVVNLVTTCMYTGYIRAIKRR